MSLAVTLAVLAEGAAPDARGQITLVAANPQALVAEHLPSQFSPILFVVVEDDSDDTAAPTAIVPGREIEVTIEAKGPDGEVTFYNRIRQPIQPQTFPALPARAQLITPVPFTAAKAGIYSISAHFSIFDEQQELVGEAGVKKPVRVLDRESLVSATG